MSDEAAAPAAAEAPAASTEAASKAAPPVAVAEPTDTYVIDGVERVLTRTQARTLIQKAGAVDKRLQQTAEEKSKLDALVKLFEEDPEAALKKLGKDPSKLFESYLSRRAQQEAMTEEQREKQRLQEELAAEKAKLKAIEDEKLTKAQQEQDARMATVLEEQLLAAANKYQLDGTPETMELMADVALEAIDLGLKITPDMVAQEVIRRQTEHVEARDKKVLSRLGDDTKLLAYLGPEVVKRVLAASLKTAPTPATKAVKQTPNTPPRGEGGKFIRESDFDKKFGFR